MPNLNPARIAWSDEYGMHRVNDLPLDVVQMLVRAGQPVIANVDNGGHFVLVVGWDEVRCHTHRLRWLAAYRSYRWTTGSVTSHPIRRAYLERIHHAQLNPDTLIVNDPGFDRFAYSYSQQVVGWRLFNITSA